MIQRQAVGRFARDTLQGAVDKHKENADKLVRKNISVFKVSHRVLLSKENIQDVSVTIQCASKLVPRFIGPFHVMKPLGDAYILDIPLTIRLHPTFYVSRLKAYCPAKIPRVIPRRATCTNHNGDGETPWQLYVCQTSASQGVQTLERIRRRLPKLDSMLLHYVCTLDASSP